jgi:hypothetical protein|tara:strand:- start:4025 stop:4516 length:492 start_codon:yes stop_codon:yes gene_type:complete
MQLVEAQNYLPPEILLDEYHPANQQYFQNLKTLEKALVAASQDAGAKYTAIAKLHHRGMRNKDIAEEIQCHAQTVGKALKSAKVKKINTLLFYLASLRDGPNLDQRKRTLWEIAVDSKELDPKTSIAALQEMNRMDGVGKEKHDTKIEVTINQALMPRGDLDK